MVNAATEPILKIQAGMAAVFLGTLVTALVFCDCQESVLSEYNLKIGCMPGTTRCCYTASMKFLLIEDDLAIGRALLAVFQDEGHSAVWLRMSATALERVQGEHFDAVILDLSLPDGDGTVLLQSMRAAGATLPVLIITARDSLQDRLNGFNIGADDYLIKPFEIPELLVRLRAIVRRSTANMDAADHVWTAGPIAVNEARMLVTRADTPVTLSKTEFALLLALIKQPDRGADPGRT
jgi:two-component system response regulator QseB